MLDQISGNDVTMAFCLIYACIDLGYEWEVFDTCQQPVHKWLLVSYVSMILMRLVYLVGQSCAVAAAHAEGHSSAVAVDFNTDLRQKGLLARSLSWFTWFLAQPFFFVWTVIGTYWLLDVVRSTPTCMPSNAHKFITIAWLIMCYVWILVHGELAAVILSLERRLRNFQQDLRLVEDADVRSRWGNVSRVSGYVSLPTDSSAVGLTPAEIGSLPCHSLDSTQCEHECSICICDFACGERVRRLPNCGHVFHRACIDLWLLRHGDCPLCKCNVLAATPACGCAAKDWEVPLPSPSHMALMSAANGICEEPCGNVLPRRRL